MNKNIESKKQNHLMFMPIVFFIICIMFFVINNKASLKTFWIGGFFSMFLAFVLTKNKGEFGEKCIEHLKNNVLINCIIIFILAGILSSILKSTGVSNAFLMLFINMGIDVRFFPLIVFIICCLVSTSIGTSTGTISMAVPIFLPLTTIINCNPALILGAIVCGSFFGDNLSPISDTTIISINTMKVELYETLKQRAKISLICFGLSCIVYIILGYYFIPNNTIVLEYNYSLSPLVMMLTFIIMAILLIKKKDIISVLLVCDMAAIVIAVLFGFINIEELLCSNSCIVTGIEGVFGVIIFWIFLFILTGFIPEETLENIANKNLKSDKKSNFLGIAIIILSILMVANNTAAMSLISKFINKCFKNKTQIEKANIFDGLSCAVPGLLPYNTAFMLMISMAYDTGCISQNFSVFSILLFSVNSIFLLVFYIILGLRKSKTYKIS